jgi:hypothetical protein
MSEWHMVNNDCGYVDFDKELYALPDVGNTSVDMRLSFDTDRRTCYYTLSLKNDDGTTREWEKEHRIPWDVGVAMLGAEGTVISE